MRSSELSRKIRQLRRLRMAQEELSAQIDALTDDLKQIMSAQEVDELAGSDFKITWKPVTTNRFDSRAFKTAMPDLYNRFITTTTTKRFLVV